MPCAADWRSPSRRTVLAAPRRLDRRDESCRRLCTATGDLREASSHWPSTRSSRTMPTRTSAVDTATRSSRTSPRARPDTWPRWARCSSSTASPTRPRVTRWGHSMIRPCRPSTTILSPTGAVAAALDAGKSIENRLIVRLQDLLATEPARSVQTVCANLLDASLNHLAAFESAATNTALAPPQPATIHRVQSAQVMAQASGRYRVGSTLVLAAHPVRTDAGVTLRWRATTETRNVCAVRTRNGVATVTLLRPGTCRVTGVAPAPSPSMRSTGSSAPTARSGDDVGPGETLAEVFGDLRVGLIRAYDLEDHPRWGR